MNKISVLIVDDELNARAALRGMIEANFSDIEIVAEAANVPEAVKLIHKHKPQVLLLDIEMPGYLGIDILDFFDASEVNFSIIFVTAYNDYALKAFEIAAVDYLLKPTRIDQLKRAFDRISSADTTQELTKYQVLKQNFELRKSKCIVLQTAEGLVFKEVDDILYFKADSAYTHVFFTNNSKITITKTLMEFCVLENTNDFLRINRSYLINLNCIEKVIKRDGGFVLMKNGEEIAASVEKRQLIFERFKDIIY
jgi:two-component system LytT family response regulator